MGMRATEGRNPCAVGIHVLLDFYGVAPGLLTDAAGLAECLREAAKASGMTALSAPVLHGFSGGGLTGFLPLAESHLAIHTYPELRYAAADIFTCGPGGPEGAMDVLRRALHPEREKVQFLTRGDEIR
jgi:S-adenosylmethionine decarboxylase